MPDQKTQYQKDLVENKARLAALKAAGMEHQIIDRSTHPQFYVSSWPVGLGHSTLGGREAYRLPNLNFNSVLVTVISNEYADGAWWRLQNMLRTTEEAGMTVALEEVDDMSTLPTDAIGQMRANAAMLALDAGFEWCLMLDTDVLLKDDTLLKLIRCDRPIVYPMLNILKDEFEGAPISSPRLRANAGLQPVAWAAMSCMLFNTKVFNCLDAYAWHGHDYHFSQQLAHFGHRVHVDTNTVVDVTRGPSRHPSKDWDRLFADLKRSHERRQREDRKRGPPPGWNAAFDKGTVDKDGVYWALDKWKYGGVYGIGRYLTGENVEESDGIR